MAWRTSEHDLVLIYRAMVEQLKDILHSRKVVHKNRVSKTELRKLCHDIFNRDLPKEEQVPYPDAEELIILLIGLLQKCRSAFKGYERWQG